MCAASSKQTLILTEPYVKPLKAASLTHCHPHWLTSPKPLLAHCHQSVLTLLLLLVSSALFVWYSTNNVNTGLEQDCAWHGEMESAEKRRCGYRSKKKKNSNFCVFCTSVKVAIKTHWFPSIPLWLNSSQINGRLHSFSSLQHSFPFFPILSLNFFISFLRWTLSLSLSTCFFLTLCCSLILVRFVKIAKNQQATYLRSKPWPNQFVVSNDVAHSLIRQNFGW